MKERPILFSGPMVRAILEGRKTQTRRIAPIERFKINPPSAEHPDFLCFSVSFSKALRRNGTKNRHFATYSGVPLDPKKINELVAGWYCPYGQPGDRLWVRETWGVPFPEDALKQDRRALHFAATETGEFGNYFRWKPSIHMPRWASRITLEITSVRVERLQDISEADAKAEGVKTKYEFEGLWTDINGAESWEQNPWVWVVEFKLAEGGAQ